ncbi:ANTAR domain-containing protein [Mycolicibacterium flavescens]|uniref:ANTAR domain-containing protein n=1 Tax=Mycolicibacterium flavescens TaxID=1776 RepID=A0A1E3RDZ5_MYCFV|nr:ANTAR domain-containing protein [Mycolicibacterium flavescens]MCV7280725.1 ANTAR domain-containing protein [Mycolicibacterium flavescens]ODQ88073.1 hypothetical protein BHQ18_21080 [Mycolicibacterium flavescens]
MVMNPGMVVGDRVNWGVRMLERAEGVVVALRRCRVEEAFAEIVDAAKRHRVPTLELAAALVGLAEGVDVEGDAGWAARYEWSSLLQQPRR